MVTPIFKAHVCELTKLENIFIEMTARNCNQRCNHCYIDFPMSKKIKDYIAIDTIKEALNDIREKDIQCIYLSGAEPMTHPDFNNILRLCLKQANVCVCTNSSLINEKKARFLKKVQGESENEIIFKLSLDHYDEAMNDRIRCRGSYRQTLSAIRHLVKYGFNPIITVTNYYHEDKNILKENIRLKFESIGFRVEDRNIIINEWFDKNSLEYELADDICITTDCKNSRTITAKGIYSCLFLANDHRGRCGSSFKDFSDKIALETPYCNTCLMNQRQVFGINFSDFKC